MYHSVICSIWISSLCRLLLRVRNYRHGGAILITPDRSFQGLNVKYNIYYPRLRIALEGYALASIQETNASDLIFEGSREFDVDEIPTHLYLDESVFRNEFGERRSELDGTIWFISLLTRVDGLVLFDGTFTDIITATVLFSRFSSRGVLVHRRELKGKR